MAIYRKERILPYLQELETFYQALRRSLEGQPPNANVAEQYHANPEPFRREFTEVDYDRVLRELERFKATASMLKQLRTKAEQPVGR